MANAFVGRTQEVKRLNRFLAAARDHAPAIVLLRGEPGIGKSTLLNRFAADATASGAQVLAGTCIDLVGGVVPYTPLVEALRLLVRQHGQERARELAGPAWSELESMISDFTGAEPAPAGPLGSQLRVFGAVLRLLDHVGGHSPVVLIFEDVHWADPSTLDFISYLARAKSNERMLMICSFRPGLPKDHHLRTLLAEPDFVRRIERINLPPFKEEDLRKFLVNLLSRPVNRDEFERYLALSEGIPFFAELLAAAHDPAAPPSARVPATITEMMLAEIDQLSDEATGIVRIAAAAGRRLSDGLLYSVSDLDELTIERALRECLARGILVREPHDETYEFRHALLRETLYQNLLPRERKRLHATMAEALAATAGADPRLAPDLAYHWFEAGRDPEALAAVVRAGFIAMRIHAFQEAEIQFKRALDLWLRVTDADAVAGITRERILGAAADAARWAGHVDRAVEWVGGAIAEVDPEANPDRAGRLHERLGSYLWEAGSIPESVEAYRTAERLLAGQEPSAVHARIMAALATAAVRAGHHLEGLRHAERAVKLARSVGARAEEGRALNSAGLALTLLDRSEEGLDCLKQALGIAAETDHLEDLLRTYGNLGLALEHAGRLDEAIDVLIKGLDHARALGLLHSRRAGLLANNVCAAFFLLGRWGEATKLLDEMLPDRPVNESLYMRLTRAEIDVACGRFDDAELLLAEARTQPISDPRFIGPLYMCLAELAAWRRDLDSARSAVARGIEAVPSTENALVLLRLCAVGLRVEADGSTGTPERSAEELLELALPHLLPEAPPEIRALARLCQAEHARADGTATIADWDEIVTAWSELDRPYPQAYALWRKAELGVRRGPRTGPAAAARASLDLARRLNASPLVREVEALARQHHLDLDTKPAKVADPKAARPGDEFSLTEREWTTFRELYAGHSNRLIAKRLSISESTASVHLSHIYRKLGVANRSEAMALAHRLGLFDNDGT